MSQDAMTAERLGEITDELLASYDHDLPDRVTLPNQQAVVSVIDECRRLLFPGYYAEEPLPESSCRFKVGTWLCELYGDLSQLIWRAFAHDNPRRDREDLRGEARRIAADFVGCLPAIREALKLDAEAALAGDPAAPSLEEVILTYPGFEAITVHRVAHWLYGAKVPYIPRAMSEHAHRRTGIDLHPGARIGKRFFIDHGTGVVIGETTDIGDDVKIYQGVTLGALSVHRRFAGTKRHPTLEDGVVIYAGATVLGGETIIGEGAVIGGNVWLTASVPPQTTVIESEPTLDYHQRRSG